MLRGSPDSSLRLCRHKDTGGTANTACQAPGFSILRVKGQGMLRRLGGAKADHAGQGKECHVVNDRNMGCTAGK
jgi:hypothetical protein